MGMYSFKPQFQALLEPLKNKCLTAKIHPTFLTITGLLSSAGIGLSLYLASHYILILILVPVLALIRIITNALDGMVARAMMLKDNAFGEVLNEFSDRVSDVLVFLGFIFSNYADTALSSLVILLILLSSYLGILSKAAGGRRQYLGFIGKADRMFYIGLLAVCIVIFKDYTLANYVLLFIGLGTVITILQRFQTIKKELRI